MSEVALRTDGSLEAQPFIGLRNLHNFIYCPRLFYLQWVENLFEENADTIEGSHVHRQVDKPSRVENIEELELPEGTKIRSLKLESQSLQMLGVVDLVEGGEDGTTVIDYKKGSARRDEHGQLTAKEADAIQVAAQALLLRDNGFPVQSASIYYAADRRRVPVELTEELLDTVRQKAAEARAVAASAKCPPPLENDPRCLYCSAYPICLPKESAWWARAREALAPDPQLRLPFDPAPTPQTLQQELRDALEFAADTTEQENITTLQAPRPEGDHGEILIVHTPGAQVGQRGEQIVVSQKGEILRKLPSRDLRAIHLYGAVQLTAQAAQTCLELSIPVAYFSPAGRYLGMLAGLPASGVDARRGQYRLFELPQARLHIAREVIRAKIHNQRTMLMRNGDQPDAILNLMAHFRDSTAQAGSLEELLGIEGSAAALYFEHFPTMLKRGEQWTFDWRGRNRRPPRDPVNALLSLGYSMLAKELTGICHAVGLDPFLGFLHQPRYGRPALALDLMEEFCPHEPEYGQRARPPQRKPWRLTV